MQLLFVIGCVAERSAPRNFFSFEGGERLSHGPLTHLPTAKVGYTLSFWMRVSAQADGEPEVSLLALPSATGQKLIEVTGAGWRTLLAIIDLVLSVDPISSRVKSWNAAMPR